EVAGFNLALGLFERLVHPGVDDRFAFLHPELAEHVVEPVRAEDPHQIVFEAEIEAGAAGVALPARAAAELVVDAPALMAFGGEHEEAAGLLGPRLRLSRLGFDPCPMRGGVEVRSEEHTSELQSRENLVCRPLLE